MKLDRRSVLLSSLGLAAFPRLALAAEPALLEVVTMQTDTALLGEAYRQLHPGLLRYQTEAGFEARLAALMTVCNRPMSLGDFYIALSRFLATIRCGHSYANFYNQTEAVQAALFSGRNRLPFAFQWLGLEMVVTGDPSGTGVASGSIIETIDGRHARDVLAALMPLVRADGRNDDKRRSLLSVQLDDEYETFDIFYSLMFGGRDRFALRVRAPDGGRRMVTLPAIDLTERRAQRPSQIKADSDAPLWTMRKTGQSAILTMPTWAVYDFKWNWQPWLDARLDELATDGSTGLIIDLRANEGGLDCGDPIVARLLKRTAEPLAAQRLVRYRQVPESLRPILRTWDKKFYDWGDRAARLDNRFYNLLPEKPEAVGIAPSGKPFRGKVVVLIGSTNSSATFNFARLVQRERLGTLVGEPTGGNRRGINGGAFFNVRLPGSKLEADLPVIATFPLSRQPDAGLLPDVSVPLTREAVASGRDDALAKALSMVA